MRLPNTFRPNKNLDEKTRQLAEGPKKKSNANLFQEGMELYNLTFDELVERVDLHDEVVSITFKFEHASYKYYLTFAEIDGTLRIFLRYICKQGGSVPDTAQYVIDTASEYCETNPYASRYFHDDENVFTWEYRTEHFFDTQTILYEIKTLLKPPLFNDLEVHCVDLGL